MAQKFNRRFVLGSAAGLTLLASIRASVRVYFPDRLVQLLPHRESARRLGLRYLDLDRNANLLVERVLFRIGAAGADINVAANSCIRDDYSHHRLVSLDGWTISETEAALCVLCATGGRVA